MIELQHLHRRFGSIVAVDDVSLCVSKGEVLGLLGPNGAGKTTTLRLLTGFLEPTRGSARICGHVMADDPLPVRRRLGYLPEGAPLWPEMTAAALLDFCGRVRGMERRTLARRRAEMTARLQLEDVLDRRVETLSRGFRRRVALAAALLHDPDIIVLDEPTDGLDPNQKQEVRELVTELAGERVIVLSTHLLEEVAALCTRVAIIHRGRIAVDETPRALSSRSRWHGAVTLRFAGAGPEPERLAAITGVVDVRTEGDGGFTLFPAVGADAGALPVRIGDFARNSNLTIETLSVHPGRLDEVFGDLTERKPRASA